MKKSPQSDDYEPLRPSLSTEGRANQLVALAYNLAEKQLREGTASSQVITEFLKLGSTKNKLELEKLKRETELLTTKAEKIKSEQRSEEVFAEAIRAMQRYNGERVDMEVDEFDY